MSVTEQTNQPFDPTNIRDLLTIVFKHKYKVLITFLLIFIGTTIFAVLFPRTYQAKSVILVKFGREFMNRPEVGPSGPGFTIPPDTIIRGEISILTSRDLLLKVINSVGVDNLYPVGTKATAGNQAGQSQQKALKSFEENLKVDSILGSSLIQVEFTHRDPHVAAKTVNTLVEAFKDKHLEVFGGNSTSFLEGQQKVFQEKLRESEGNLASFKAKNRVFSFEEQRTNLIGQQSALETSLKAAQNQLNEQEQKIAFIRGPKWAIDMPPEMRSQQMALQQRERELLEKYTETSGAVRNVRQEIQILKDTIKKNTEETRQLELGKAEGDLIVMKTRVANLRQELGQVQGELRTLDGRGRELQELKREASQQEQNYQTYARKLEESLIMDDMDRRKMVAIAVVEKAAIPTTPKKKKLTREQMVIAGFFGGIIAGIGLAFLLEFMTSSMTTPFSAERRLGLPVLVAVTKK